MGESGIPTVDLHFAETDPASPEAVALVSALDDDLHARYPGMPVNGIEPDAFRRSGGVFLAGRIEGVPVACGAIRPLGGGAAEVKRMYVRRDLRRRGYATAILDALEDAAIRRGYHTLRLETGSGQPEAIALYVSAGFHRIPCFGQYVTDERARCFEKALTCFEARVIGCFKGLATGDAIGKQTETLSRDAVQQWYPDGITGLHGRPGDVIPRYAGKRYEWRIGETTDDTEQTLAVARAILNERQVTHEAIGRELMKCRKSAHPGVSLWAFLEAGDPARIAADGDGCGAAMRTSPIGVIFPSSDLTALTRAARECALPTHGGAVAIEAATAVAGAISAALEGRCSAEILAAAPVSIGEIYADLQSQTPLTAAAVAARHFPGDAQTVVALAIALALLTGSAEQTALLAANIGGDADSVASIGGAIAGAMHPETVNHEWFEIVRAVNPDPLLDLAYSLAGLRAKKGV